MGWSQVSNHINGKNVQILVLDTCHSLIHQDLIKNNLILDILDYLLNKKSAM